MTEKQKELLIWILQYTVNNLYQPSIREMAQRFGISVRATYDMLKGLEQKGYVSNSGCSRALKISDKTREQFGIIARLTQGENG